ncbi:hypothetical protein CICLE_v10010446mg [Citrus x clementina]|uniref:Uncharacterized protein n=1 Tax=Citrus clementina TaxID=85681 RepID=V4TSJ7_CITCL|nr:hypothetical protein CICLE_v10010446mg [Citrus x clementina]
MIKKERLLLVSGTCKLRQSQLVLEEKLLHMEHQGHGFLIRLIFTHLNFKKPTFDSIYVFFFFFSCFVLFCCPFNFGSFG